MSFKVCLLSVALCCTPLFSLEASRSISQYTHTSWSLRDGAPSAIEALAQTKDGYLWIGTANGLYRFDGVKFERYETASGAALPGRNVRSLLALPNGDLWIGFQAGGLTLLRNGEPINYAVREGVPNGRVLALTQDQDGSIWVGTSAGLARFQGGTWQAVGKDWNFPGDSARSLFVDRHGTLWIATRETLVYLRSGSKRFEPTGLHIGYVAQITEDPDGRLWLAETSRSVHPVSLEGKASTEYATEILVGSGQILFDHEGALWVTTVGDGLRHVATPGQLAGKIAQRSDAIESYTVKDGMTDDASRAILQDHEGNIWVGTQNGLDQFRKGNIVPVPMPINVSMTTLAAGQGGDVWVNSLGTLIRIHDGKTYQVESHVGSTVSAYREPKGVIFWIADDAIFRLEKEHVTRLPLPHAPAKPYNGWGAIVVTEDHAGLLWAAVEHEGLFYFKAGVWQRFETPPGWEKLTPRTAFTDDMGRAWFGYSSGTVAWIECMQMHTLSTGDNSAVGGVEAIGGDARHLWGGGEQGLAIFEGNRFQPVLPNDTKAFERVSGIEITLDGSLWLCESRGLIHIGTSELHKRLADPAYRVAYQVFDSDDGLPGAFQEVGQVSREIQGTDGRLWFTATKGVAWIDPSTLSRNLIPPPVSIQSVEADGKMYRSLDGLTLPALTTNIHLSYTALSLSVPQRVRFRYKLEQMDKDWQEAGSRRETMYTELAPGKYRFHVIACNNDGIWNDTGAVLNFSVAPAWFQTVWFRAICASLAVLLLWVLYRVQMRRMASELNARFDERLTERTRLARDLHDTLLQTVQVSKLTADDALEGAVDAKRMHQTLEKLSKWLGQAVDEGRAALQSLRVSTAETNHFAEALQRASEEHLLPPAMSVVFSITGDARDVQPIVGDEVYRIGYEAIRNAVAHSSASRMEVEIHYAKDLSIRISDNGSGIDPDLLKNGRDGHFGLQGMRERAERIRGKLVIASSAKTGTGITLIVPGAVVYRDAGKTTMKRLKGAVRKLLGS